MLDFDGPVCSVFAGFPAPVVANRLASGLGNAPDNWLAEEDPMALLRQVSAERPEATMAADELLERLEVEAVGTAEPTPGAEAVIRACAASGRRVWMVSNNAPRAIEEYLAARDLRQEVSGVFGRPIGDPSLMKPNPHLLLEMLAAASAEPTGCVFVGDAVTDVQAGLAASMPTIGYANKPGKDVALARAGATAVVDSMHVIAEALTRSSCV
ncbi:HAD family hydrolase [Streptacidiphilus sp. MAP5-52]|uniref:HAD family hydrolase n=1 Tax=Streptacidiphilus sp. MAP5-52 TaxID=3156267 RepID=UPI003516C22C